MVGVSKPILTQVAMSRRKNIGLVRPLCGTSFASPSNTSLSSNNVIQCPLVKSRKRKLLQQVATTRLVGVEPSRRCSASSSPPRTRSTRSLRYRTNRVPHASSRISGASGSACRIAPARRQPSQWQTLATMGLPSARIRTFPHRHETSDIVIGNLSLAIILDGLV